MRVSDFPQNTQRHLANNRNPVSEQHKTRESVRCFFSLMWCLSQFPLPRTRSQICGTTEVQSHQILDAFGTGLHAFRTEARWSDQSEYPSPGVRTKSPNGPPAQTILNHGQTTQTTDQTTDQPPKPPTKPRQNQSPRFVSASVCRAAAPCMSCHIMEVRWF